MRDELMGKDCLGCGIVRYPGAGGGKTCFATFVTLTGGSS